MRILYPTAVALRGVPLHYTILYYIILYYIILYRTVWTKFLSSGVPSMTRKATSHHSKLSQRSKTQVLTYTLYTVNLYTVHC